MTQANSELNSLHPVEQQANRICLEFGAVNSEGKPDYQVCKRILINLIKNSEDATK